MRIRPGQAQAPRREPPPELEDKPESRPPEDEWSPGLAVAAIGLAAVSLVPKAASAAPTVEVQECDSECTLSQSGRFTDPGFQRVLEGGQINLEQHGPHVKAVQQALIDNGFHISTGASGTFDLYTLVALTNFRESQNLEISFGLDAASLQRLDQVSPRAGLKAWEDPDYQAPAAPEVLGRPVRALVDISEHRLFLYDGDGQLEHIYSVATGDADQDAGTDTGLKMVVHKNSNPESEAVRIWGPEKNLVFGTRLLNLSWVNLENGTVEASDQELHGTYLPESVGLDISLGCMRLTNADMEDLYNRVQVDDLVMVRE